jgi:hypothetical protein
VAIASGKCFLLPGDNIIPNNLTMPAYCLQADGRQRDPAYNVLDLKADYRGYTYVEETIKLLPEKPEPVLLTKILNHVAGLGRIHVSQPSFSLS